MNAQSSKIYNEEKASYDNNQEVVFSADEFDKIMYTSTRHKVKHNFIPNNIIDLDFVVQIKYASNQAAQLTRLHLTELGYEAEVIKMVV